MADGLDLGGFIVKYANTEGSRRKLEICPIKKDRCDEHGFDICQACMFHHERDSGPSSISTQQSTDHSDWVINQTDTTSVANSTEDNIFLNSNGEDERPLPLRLMKVAGKQPIGRDTNGKWSIAGPYSNYANNPYLVDGPVPFRDANTNEYPVLEQYPLTTQYMWGAQFLPQWDEQVNGLEVRRQFENIGHIPLIPDTTNSKQKVPLEYCQDCKATWLKGRDAEAGQHTHQQHPVHGSLKEHEAHESLVNHRSLVVSVAGCQSKTDDKNGGVGVYWGPDSCYNANRQIDFWDQSPMTKETAELMAVYKLIGDLRGKFGPEFAKMTKQHRDDELAKRKEEARREAAKLFESIERKKKELEDCANKKKASGNGFAGASIDTAIPDGNSNESFSSGTLVSKSPSTERLPASAAPTSSSFDFIPTPTSSGFGTVTRQKNPKGKKNKKTKKDKKKENKKKAQNAHKRKVSSGSISSFTDNDGKQLDKGGNDDDNNNNNNNNNNNKNERSSSSAPQVPAEELKVSPKFAVETPFSLTAEEKESAAKTMSRTAAARIAHHLRAVSGISAASSSSSSATITPAIEKKFAVETPFSLTEEEKLAIEKQSTSATAAAVSSSSQTNVEENKGVDMETEKETDDETTTLRLIIATDSDYLYDLFTRDLPNWTWDPEEHIYRRPVFVPIPITNNNVTGEESTDEKDEDEEEDPNDLSSSRPPMMTPLQLARKKALEAEKEAAKLWEEFEQLRREDEASKVDAGESRIIHDLVRGMQEMLDDCCANEENNGDGIKVKVEVVWWKVGDGEEEEEEVVNKAGELAAEGSCA